MAQNGGMTFLPMDDQISWNYTGPRDTPGSTTAIYSENTAAAFFIPYTQNGITAVADDMPGAVNIFTVPDGNLLPISVTGFSFTYTLRASISQLPVTATVRFIGLGVQANFITADYGSIVVNSLATGTVVQTVTLADNDKFIIPANSWMEISFSPVGDLAATTRTEDIGWGIAADIHSEGAPAMGNSDDIYMRTDALPAGSPISGIFWFGGYTPLLPTTDPNYTLPGNFLYEVFGKKIPEPTG
jgi:3D (Asp-Asp-Asp) domain-containing protein